MINYEPNKNWLRDLSHFNQSKSIRKIYRSVFALGASVALFCFMVDHFDWHAGLAMGSGVYSLLGIALSIVLVFRTNTAYDRWWEGRKQWGALVNNCRNLAIMLHASLPEADKETRKFYAKHISNFCIAFKEHLRQGTNVEELILLKPEEKEQYKTKNHIPNHISSIIYKGVEQAHRKGEITDVDFRNMAPQLASLLDILGACERIKNTPIPFSYSIYIKLFIIFYGLFLPLGLIEAMGYWTIPMSMIVFFAFIGLELMAEEIEEPFGNDNNDLPTATIAHNIKNNVFEILEARHTVVDVKKDDEYVDLP
ncbi:bestrophin family ion channel [soil metagenome]